MLIKSYGPHLLLPPHNVSDMFCPSTSGVIEAANAIRGDFEERTNRRVGKGEVQRQVNFVASAFGIAVSARDSTSLIASLVNLCNTTGGDVVKKQCRSVAALCSVF